LLISTNCLLKCSINEKIESRCTLRNKKAKQLHSLSPLSQISWHCCRLLLESWLGTQFLIQKWNNFVFLWFVYCELYISVFSFLLKWSITISVACCWISCFLSRQCNLLYCLGETFHFVKQVNEESQRFYNLINLKFDKKQRH
jgi:hypothetical protein